MQKVDTKFGFDNKPYVEYIAHKNPDTNAVQTLHEHLNNTAQLASDFASYFDASEVAFFVGFLHDIGKYSAEFQARINGANITVDHSTAGGQLACDLYKNILGHIAAYCIMGHHAGLPDGGANSDNPDGSATLDGRLRSKVAYYKNFDEKAIPTVDLTRQKELRTPFDVAFFTRMVFSCLVDADFLDTEQFFDVKERGCKTTIAQLHSKLFKYIQPYLSTSNDSPIINQRRTNLLKSCISKSAVEPGLFTLTAPTGSGKTVSSLAFALEHAKTHNKRRIIYVVPYNTIIEQNAAEFEKILGSDNVLQHHSNISYDCNDKSAAQEEATELERKRLATENWDYPIVVTSVVQFFESLFSNKPSKCRKLHNISDSVIIFDEAQMLPLPYAAPCIKAICQLIKSYGCTALLATATQFKWDEIKHDKKAIIDLPITELADDPTKLYNDFKRVNYVNHAEPFSTESLADEIIGACSDKKSVLCIVNNRRRAQDLYALLRNDEGIFHLSTTMYPTHRSKVLSEIRQRLKLDKKCIVISTSLVEAGVDLDFRTVYREKAGLDSILQAGGRCNREGKCAAEDSIVNIFAFESGNIPAEVSQRASVFDKIQQQLDDVSTLEAIENYFNELLNAWGGALDRDKIIEKLSDASCMYDFKEVSDKFKVIKDISATVYVLDANSALRQRIYNGERTRGLFRQLAQYSVALTKSDFKKYEELGLLEFVDSQVVLLDSVNYDEFIGVALELKMKPLVY
ncbi:MAG: CRISPR-associated helicase Cas3' [Clostridiales bacterium]|jgi:CRISPR-associated endonuclease/helicase Cas3|nr:CRISPR-associated helicase Cas3' [Clostridiales bacterium]